MNIGLEELQRQLSELGYSPIIVENTNRKFVKFEFLIPVGRFKGKEVEIALEAPHFPLNPPSGPFLKPHIMPISGNGGNHPTGGIHAMNLPTPDYQYWSRPFSNWKNSEMTAKVYLAFIRTLFDFE